jgi:hypothetical protein
LLANKNSSAMQFQGTAKSRAKITSAVMPGQQTGFDGFSSRSEGLAI